MIRLIKGFFIFLFSILILYLLGYEIMFILDLNPGDVSIMTRIVLGFLSMFITGMILVIGLLFLMLFYSMYNLYSEIKNQIKK